MFAAEFAIGQADRMQYNQLDIDTGRSIIAVRRVQDSHALIMAPTEAMSCPDSGFIPVRNEVTLRP